MYDTMKTKNAIPSTASASGRERNITLQVVDQRLDRLPRERPIGAGGGEPNDQGAGGGADHRQRQQDHADPDFVIAEPVEEQAAGDGAEDAGEEGGRFENAVAAREDVAVCRISGMAPYLAGAKKAACVPIRKTHDITIQPPTFASPA